MRMAFFARPLAMRINVPAGWFASVSFQPLSCAERLITNIVHGGKLPVGRGLNVSCAEVAPHGHHAVKALAFPLCRHVVLVCCPLPLLSGLEFFAEVVEPFFVIMAVGIMRQGTGACGFLIFRVLCGALRAIMSVFPNGVAGT